MSGWLCFTQHALKPTSENDTMACCHNNYFVYIIIATVRHTVCLFPPHGFVDFSPCMLQYMFKWFTIIHLVSINWICHELFKKKTISQKTERNHLALESKKLPLYLSFYENFNKFNAKGKYTLASYFIKDPFSCQERAVQNIFIDPKRSKRSFFFYLIPSVIRKTSESPFWECSGEQRCWCRVHSQMLW